MVIGKQCLAPDFCPPLPPPSPKGVLRRMNEKDESEWMLRLGAKWKVGFVGFGEFKGRLRLKRRLPFVRMKSGNCNCIRWIQRKASLEATAFLKHFSPFTFHFLTS